MTTWISRAALVAAWLMAGCGDDSSSVGPEPDVEPIRIGQLTTLSGALARLGTSWRAAAQMAVDEINTAGGVLGRSLEIVVADTETDPDAAVLSARALVAQEVVAIVGPQISSATLSVAQEVTIQAGVPIISPSSTSAGISDLVDGDLVWRTSVSDVFKGRIVARYIYETGSRRAGVIFVDNDFGRGLSEEFTNAYESLGGQVVNRVNYPELDGDAIEAHDYRPHAEAVVAGEPDLVYVISYNEDGVKIMISADAAITDTYHPRFMSELAPSEDLLALISVYEGLLGLQQQSPTTANQEQFASSYLRRYGGEPLQFADGVYDAVYLLALATEQAGSTDGAAIATALRAVSKGGTAVNAGDFARAKTLIADGADIDYEGASGVIDFDDRGDVTSGTFRVWTVQNAAFVDVTTITFP